MAALGNAVTSAQTTPFETVESRRSDPNTLDLSVVMPCLNESLTLGACIRKAQATIERLGIRGEVIVADNGSTDGSRALAEELGARVVPIESRGYGNALRGGIAASRGRYVIMGDSDDSYDFTQLGDFVAKLDEGYELVMGNRYRGEIRPGAMPFLHRFLGNPVLSGLGRLFFGCPVGDFQCGLRGFRKDSLDKLDLRTTGMEFSTEMVVKATLFDLRIIEIPTTLSPEAAIVRRTCEHGGTDGVIFAFFCSTARAGCSSIPESFCSCLVLR